MRLKLDFEDVRFATTTSEHIGNIRWMVVNIGEKKFHVRRQMDTFYHPDEEKFRDEIDKLLIKEMEYVLQKVLEEACNAVPDGQELFAKE